jgi:PKD repeat protein
VNRVRTRLGAVTVAMALGATALATLGGTAHALSNPAVPQLNFDHVISSKPFSGGPSASDVEGLGYVAADDSMWVADDNGDKVYEINASTGAWKSTLTSADFIAATQEGGVTPSDITRADDLESVVYDGSGTLYVTSGNCCNTPTPGPPYFPTVYKLTKDVPGHTGQFWPKSWQALPEGQDPTAAGWRPGVGMYYGKGTKIKTYDFASNTPGSDMSFSIGTIVGIDFTDASTAFITTATVNTASGRTTATSDSTIHRFDISGSTWTENLNWKLPLASIGTAGGSTIDDGVIDARDTSIVGDKFYVSDGYDSRTGGDHPIYVYNLVAAPGPTAAFSAIPTTGRAPYTVQFTDQSTPVAPATGHPTSWAWDFDGNNITDSTLQNPTHEYTVAGTYTVKLTATNAAGSTSITHTITVKAATALPGGYTLDGYGGLHPFRAGTGTLPVMPTGGPYWNGWDIARGVAVAADGQNGFVLDGFGGLHPFRIGGGANPAVVTGGPYWNGWDIARGIALLPNGNGGYVLDAFGGVHPFALGGHSMPPDLVGVPYWANQDMAQGITITADGKGGYVVDRGGVLHRFKVGNSGTLPPRANSVAHISIVAVQGVSLLSDDTGGFTVDGWGGLHGFGVGVQAPPSGQATGYWPNWNIARDIATMPDA